MLCMSDRSSEAPSLLAPGIPSTRKSGKYTVLHMNKQSSEGTEHLSTGNVSNTLIFKKDDSDKAPTHNGCPGCASTHTPGRAACFFWTL